MRRALALLILLPLLAYGLVRIGVGGALLAQSLDWVALPALAEAVSEVGAFIEARAARQILPFSVPGYFVYILAMGVVLTVGAVGVLVRRRWGHVSLGLYLAMHAALFVNFREINPKLFVLAGSLAMVVALLYLRPPVAGKA